MKKSFQQWVCSDRELRLRSKLDVGWSAKSSKFRTVASNNKDEMEKSSNTSTNQITSYEQEMILEVLRRSKEVDQMEEIRINKLLERFKTIKKNAKGDGNETCVFCNNQLSFSFFNFYNKICSDCKKYICNKCSITIYSTTRKKVTLCRLCSETRENNQNISDTNEKAADLITDSIHRRCSSEQAYYEIINNKFEISSKASRNPTSAAQNPGEKASLDKSSADQQQTIDQHHLLKEKEVGKSTTEYRIDENGMLVNNSNRIDKSIQQNQQNSKDCNLKFNNDALNYQNLINRKQNRNDDGNQRFETNRMNETANKSTKDDVRSNENAGNQMINLKQNAYQSYGNANGSNGIHNTYAGFNNCKNNLVLTNNYLQPSYQQRNQSYDSRSSLSEASTPDTIVYNSISSISSIQSSIANTGNSLAASNNQLKASSPINQAKTRFEYVPDRFRNQNSLAPNNQNSFYYSLPTTPSCPMQTLNQHHSNQQIPNQYHQTNPFVQTNLQPSYSGQNQLGTSNNLINSLCSPVRMNKNNPFINRNLPMSSSTNYVMNSASHNYMTSYKPNQIANHYKASSSSLANHLTNNLANNLADNQLMSTMNQTNLVNLNKQSDVVSSLNSNDLVTQSIQTNFTNSNYLMVDKTKYLN